VLSMGARLPVRLSSGSRSLARWLLTYHSLKDKNYKFIE
jgi:hypothetical protein